MLLLLAQISGCAGVVCSPGMEEPYGSRKLPVWIRDVEDAVTLPDGDVVVVARRYPTATVVTRIGGRGDEEVALLPEMAPTDVAPSLILTDGRWWFSRMGLHDPGTSVFFVSGGATIQQSERSVDGYGDIVVWLPVRGVEPRGLLLSGGNEQPALRVVEITPSGAKTLGAFTWWQRSSQMVRRHDSRWSAESLGDGRFVVAAIDGPPGETALRVRLVGGEAASDEVVPCRLADQPIDTAVGPTGRLAVVGLSEKNEVVGVMPDVAHPESAQCRVLSAAGEVAARPGYGTPTVVWAGDRFIAAWVRDDGTVRACELDELQRSRVIVDIGREADVDRPLRQLLQAGADAVTFTWRDRSGDLFTRELPNKLTAYALMMEFRSLVCAAVATGGERDEGIRHLFPLPLRELIWGPSS